LFQIRNLLHEKLQYQVISDPNYFNSYSARFIYVLPFTLILVYQWYEDQVASVYSGEQGLSEGI